MKLTRYGKDMLLDIAADLLDAHDSARYMNMTKKQHKEREQALLWLQKKILKARTKGK